MPTGSVAFFIGGLQVGTTNCTGSNGQPADCLDSTGTATASLPNVASGTYQVYASYSGDANYARVSYTNSVPASFTVLTNTVDNTTTTLQITPSSSVTANQSATLLATVVDENNVPVTQGSVTFFNLTTNAIIGSDALDSSGQASYTSSSWPVGTFKIEATYVGPIAFGASAGSATMTVTNNVSITNTTTSLVISPPKITAAEPTVLEATVVDSNGNYLNTGTVTFFNTTTNSPVGTVNVVNGQADLLVGDWPVGTFVIEATYQGPITMAPSGDSQNLVVFSVAGNTTTTVTAVSPSPAQVGQAIQLTASVTSNEAGTDPTGTVTFYSDGIAIGTGTLDSNDIATLTSPNGLPAGTHQITASYGGDNLNNPSAQSAPVPLVVNQVVETTTTPTVSPSPSVLGSTVTLSATVTAPSGSPTGTVSFNLGSATGTLLCSSTLSSGVASCNTSALPLGQDTVVASYGGDALDNPSSGSTQTTVGPAPSATTVSASPATSVQGAPVTLSATVASSTGLSITPTGTVTFTLGTASGASVCVATLSNGTATCTTTALPAGTSTIVATYGGDANYSGSSNTTSASVTAAVIVDVSGTMTQGTSQPTFTYTATPPAGVTVSGSLTCQTVDSGTAIGPSLASGSYTIDGATCSGLSAGGLAIDYVGVTDGFLVSGATSGSCSSLTLPPLSTAVTGAKHGNITVPSGQTLYIAGGSVSGNVFLEPGAALVMTSGTIGGNITVSAGDPVMITGGTVDGGLTTSDSAVSLCGGTIDGKVVTTGGSLLVKSTSIHGGICTSGAEWVAISGSIISGDVVISDTTGTPPAGVSKASPTENYICSTSISGRLDLSHNSSTFEIGQGPDCTGGVSVGGGIEKPSGSGPTQCGSTTWSQGYTSHGCGTSQGGGNGQGQGGGNGQGQGGGNGQGQGGGNGQGQGGGGLGGGNGCDGGHGSDGSSSIHFRAF